MRNITSLVSILMLTFFVGSCQHTQQTDIGLPKLVYFNEAYKHAHENKITIEIPEVSELANILMAISDVGLKDSNMINMKIPYHNEVLKWFLKYKNEPIIKTIDSLQEINDKANNYFLYYNLKMNACGYYFNKEENIVLDSVILKWGFYDEDDAIEKNLIAIENFAEKSNFRQFYSNHKEYYDSLTTDYKKHVSVLKMKHWLESQFPNKIDYYIITFSPLVNGAHSTNSFYGNDFSVAVMFVAPFSHSSVSPSDEIHYDRLLFTEIDHNYVNRASYEYKDNINYIFRDRKKWKGSNGEIDSAYPNGLSVFNEYMTWAVFTLYCYDNYSHTDFDRAILYVENYMEQRRGFIQFAAFDKALLNLYKHNKSREKVYDLFPDILQWCASH